jgi:hypothetical protein
MKNPWFKIKEKYEIIEMKNILIHLILIMVDNFFDFEQQFLFQKNHKRKNNQSQRFEVKFSSGWF